MSVRSTTRDTGRRTLVAMARALFKKADDTKRLQEVDLELLADEKKPKVERFQEYGITSVPLKPTDEGKETERDAEIITLFIGTERTHAVIIRCDDRRYRLLNHKEGEVAVYDDQQQKVAIKRKQVLTRSQFKIAARVVKDEEQAKETAGRDQSKQDDDADDQQQDQQDQQQGQEQEQFKKGESKKTKPLSSYIADKDSITLIRQKDNGDMLSQLVLKIADDQSKEQSGNQSQSDKKDKIELTTPLPTFFGLNEKNKQIKATTPKNTVQLQEVVHNDELDEPLTRIIINSNDDESHIELTTKNTSIVLDEKNKLITIHNSDSGGKVTISAGPGDSNSPTVAVRLDPNKQQVQVGDFTAQNKIAMMGTVDSAGYADVIKLAKKAVAS